MSSDRHYPEDAPAHRMTVDPFRIDAVAAFSPERFPGTSITSGSAA
jgi:hypothetical protein